MSDDVLEVLNREASKLGLRVKHEIVRLKGQYTVHDNGKPLFSSVLVEEIAAFINRMRVIRHRHSER